MPRVTNRKLKYEGKDGAKLKCSIRSDSSGGCRYARMSGMRPGKKRTDYFSIDVCVDCGTVYFKNNPGFRVESSEADLLRLTLFKVKSILAKEYLPDLRDVFGLSFSKGAKEAIQAIDEGLNIITKKKKEKRS